MAIGPLPPVISEIQANSGQPGKMLARQQAASSLLDLQTEATTPLAANILPETTLLEDAVAAALGRQGGLADLYATLTQLSGSADLPDKVKAAIQQVLAFQMSDGDVTPERLAQAIRSSGLFHEAVAAGKMMAALPQAVRQALGRSADGSAQVQVPTTPRGAASPTPPTSAPSTTQSQATPTAASTERPAAPSGALASAIASYGRSSGAPSQPGATQLAASVAQTTAQAAATPAVAGSAPTPGVTPQASPPTQVSTSAGQPLPTTGQTPAAPPQTVVPTIIDVVGQPAQTATPLMGEGSPLPQAGPTPASASGPQQASQAPQPATAGTTAPTTTMPAASSGAASSQQAAPNGTQQPSSAATPTGVQAQSQPATPSAATPTPASNSPNPQAPDTAPAAQVGSKSFAPWTPGRPMTQPPAAGQPTASQPAATSPAPTSQPAATASAPPNSPPQAEGESPSALRPATDRPLFVPSSVDSLPSRPAGAQPPATAAPTPPAGGTPAQPGTAPAIGQAQTATSHSLASSPVTGQPATSGAAQVATPSAQPATTTQTTSSSATTTPATTGASPKPEATQFRPASGSSVPPATPQAAAQLPVGLDLKGAIDLLRRELIVWLGRSADVMASADGAADDATGTRVDRPAPPRRNGPVRGQPAVDRGAEALDALSTESLAGRALGEAERSLSRVFLHQAATAETRDPRAPQVAQAMMMEIPIAGPNGTSIAQLRIERDEHPPSEPGAPPRRVFQVDVAFDIVPLGPVVVRVGLMDGRRVAIGVWCETDNGLVRMEAERNNIVIGLEAEGMTVAGVDLHKGHPPEGGEETATVARNHRLDLQL
jgi:hypothetical protein